MAFKAGTASAFYLCNIAAAAQNLSPYIDNVSVPNTVQQLEVSAFGTAAKAFITGLTDGDTVTISGPYDVAVHTHLSNLKAGQNAGSAAAGFFWGPGGSVASQARVGGSVFVASYTLSSTVGGRVEYSASLQVSGATTLGTF